MRDENSDRQTAAWKSGVGRIVAALVGLLVASGYLWLLVYLLSGKVVVDADIIIFCFLVCGVAAAIGFIFVYRLLPRHEPMSLFDGSVGVDVPGMSYPGIHSQLETHGKRQQSVSRYNTPEGGGAVGFIVLIGMGLILIRFSFPAQFLSLSIPAGCFMALVLYWVRRWRQGSSGSLQIWP